MLTVQKISPLFTFSPLYSVSKFSIVINWPMKICNTCHPWSPYRWQTQHLEPHCTGARIIISSFFLSLDLFSCKVQPAQVNDSNCLYKLCHYHYHHHCHCQSRCNHNKLQRLYHRTYHNTFIYLLDCLLTWYGHWYYHRHHHYPSSTDITLAVAIARGQRDFFPAKTKLRGALVITVPPSHPHCSLS